MCMKQIISKDIKIMIINKITLLIKVLKSETTAVTLKKKSRLFKQLLKQSSKSQQSMGCLQPCPLTCQKKTHLAHMISRLLNS